MSQGTQRGMDDGGGPRRAVPAGSGAPSTSSSGTSGSSWGIGGAKGSRAPEGSSSPAGTVAPPDLRLLGEELRAAVVRTVAGRREASLLFSGGIDSSLVGHLLRPLVDRRELDLDVVTVGASGAPDIANAEHAAAQLGLSWRGVTLRAEEIREAAAHVRELLGLPMATGAAPPLEKGAERVALEVQTGMFLALRATRSEAVLCGQGADELFLGYAHFASLRGTELKLRQGADLTQLIEQDLPATERIAGSFKKRVLAPYLDPRWLAIVNAVPLEQRRPHGVPKGLLREVASSLQLPPALVDRPKKAFQYGSGIHAVLGRSRSVR